MGERMTCALIGLMAGGVAGFFTRVGLDEAQTMGVILLAAVLLGAAVGSVATLIVGVSRADRLMAPLALLGLILGGLAGLISAVGVIVLGGVLPWYLVGAALGFLVGWLLCWLCDRGERGHGVRSTVPHA